MKYLLDTNTCIRFLNGRSPSIKTHIMLNTREFSRVNNLQIEDWEAG